ncbi:MAG TPA: helicase-related protein [Burkholderiaceae bacterium]|nr:helicase-related protein [Burkholderiaceae bacterium]
MDPDSPETGARRTDRADRAERKRAHRTRQREARQARRDERRTGAAREALAAEAVAERVRETLPERLKDFFPVARRLGRRITFVAGPTNSGKTHAALDALCAADTGVYLGPLRLLALEVCETMRARGVRTSLVTGEYVETDEAARHTSATVEMLDLRSIVDVAVLDEIQMLDDRERGGVWLQAMLGAPARHLIVVGSPQAETRVRAIAAYLGEPLELVRKERLAPLEVAPRPVDLDDPEPGTAYVVFSRGEALALSAELRRAGHPTSVIYGALSPEVRREQARLFREGVHAVLVATDAIGMGLNLPIRTIVFTTDRKWDGVEETALSPMLVKQIAGRAGRYGRFESGRVSALDRRTLAAVRERLAAPDEPSGHPIVLTLNRMVAHAIAEQLDTDSALPVLRFYLTRIAFEPWVRPTATREQVAIARMADRTGLRLDDTLRILNAPAFVRDEPLPWFGDHLRAIRARRRDRAFWLHAPVPAGDLDALEAGVRDATLYCWMHYRYPDCFPDLALARERLAELDRGIVRALAQRGARRCASCGRPMPWDLRHRLCDGCFRARSTPRDRR